jgi:hypothetical protein
MEQTNTNQGFQDSYAPAPQGNISVGDWVLTIFITAIPLVGLIMLFVWAFSGGTPASKANWAKAMLIWAAIGIVLSIAFWGMFAAALSSF